MNLLDWIGSYDGDPEYEFDKLAIEVGEQIVARMEERGMTQADVAREMGVSRARVSQILRGNDNLTLKSIVAVAVALDSRVDFRLRDARAAANGLKWPTGYYRQIPDADIPRNFVQFASRDWLAMGGAADQHEPEHADRAAPEFATAA